MTGEYRNTLDEKGRIMFPVKLRTELTGSSLILTRGIDRCLWLFPPEQWQVLSDKVMESASLFQSQSRSVLRRLVAPAQVVEFDKTGRISIPQSLREFAGLGKNCVFLGINKYFELWDSQEYENYLGGSEADFREATEGLGNICL
ncbi:MAG TPA: division/cell wall cluster transcriptional repressor MraZ [Treponemataceae bacterium]|nr:division/cell wall cluster transcriptional repressor MraZ [Treponemataceae bacterium]HOS34704.1 division/cell wall cluster transcriptional repressor MraZ [Treponemataceae bacterium]HOU39000.1 division/cell wall cluster transcriptional repressor MraZ [Treponemataceae bacterium]HPA10971.1 division/cell wall cluster transcriptional repressor MraZ [Treponemataceae bacterium]HPL91377.1 division/cell wall cluster transcriptional repressor MraZ [Treponemataceae bacterium]